LKGFFAGVLAVGSVWAAAQPAPAATARFTDVTREWGIAFKHVSGAFGKKYLPETMGSGVAVLDYDGDGRQDLFFVNGTRFPGSSVAPAYSALYRNEGPGQFKDVTASVGLKVEAYGLGVAAADYDNDGDLDLYLTALGPNHLFRNDAGHFKDVTAEAGVGDPGFSASAAFLDYDKDGRLDLFVTNYVEWTQATDLRCTLNGRDKSYCTPESYKGQSVRLYRNLGTGKFEDATKRAGLLDANSKALGVAVFDFDQDGASDLFVANDTQPNKLYRNKGDGTFEELGVAAGVAFSETGVARAGMGVDAGDYDGSGRPGLVIGNFSNETMSLYHNEGHGLFLDDSPASGIGKESLLTLTFGAFFFDFDLDGRLDIFASNGHVADEIQSVQPRVAYAQPPHLFRNLGNRRFRGVGKEAGPALQQAVVGRGAAYGDLDGDGDLDVVLAVNGGPARVLRNDTPMAGTYVRLRTVGERSNRDGLGARATLSLSSGRKASADVKTGSSYCSQSELPLTFGLAPGERAQKLEVRWPSGKVDVLDNPATGKLLVVKEGLGLVK